MTTVVLLFALIPISKARNVADVVVAGAFGFAAIYFMINPVKASYSAGPTVASCLVFTKQQGTRIATLLMLGLLVGALTNFRLANLWLSAGYVIMFAIMFLTKHDLQSFVDGAVFGAGLLVGLLPVLAAQAINAGSPFRTTYSPGDAAPPQFTSEVALYYLTDTQGFLTMIAIVLTAITLFKSRSAEQRQTAWLVAANLAVCILFFFSHPLITPYYLTPVAMLSLWTLLFPHLAFSRQPSAKSSSASRSESSRAAAAA